MGKRVLILSAGVGSGHNVAAAALETLFQRKSQVDVVRTLDALKLGNRLHKALVSDAYFAMVEAAPWLVALFYDINDTPFKDAKIMTLWDQLNASRLVEEIRDYQPDVVVCTHFLPAKLVSLLLSRRELHATLSVVTTDYDVQGLWLSSPFNHYFVAREETRAYMLEMGLPPDRIILSGIPVSPVFSQPFDPAPVRERYQLRPDIPMLLISAGAAGSEYTQKIVIQTMQMSNPFQAVVICGRNRELKAEINELVVPLADRFRVLGFTREMPDLMRTATLFIGKPGGLTSSECMAAGLPMVMVRPIPGQEVRNSDYLLEEGAAVRCNYDTTIGYKIDCLLGDTERLRRMAESARRVGQPQAASKIVNTVLEDDSSPLWISRAAQNAIEAAAEKGPSLHYATTKERVHTIIDAQTGRSAGVVTDSQLNSLAPILPATQITADGITISSELIGKLKRHHTGPDLLAIIARIRDTTKEISIGSRWV